MKEKQKSLPKKPRTEKWAYQNRVKPLLKASGCRYNRIENTAGKSFPDLDLTFNGLNIKLEMKLARGGKGRMHIDEGQYEWHRREHKAMGNAFILAYWADKDELHLFKIGPKPALDEPEKYRLMDYETRIINEWQDLFTIRAL